MYPDAICVGRWSQLVYSGRDRISTPSSFLPVAPPMTCLWVPSCYIDFVCVEKLLSILFQALPFDSHRFA